ncbi:MAG: hypothetical protein K2P93_01060 [Alphaproteobacteria bacterium]|nr:hypothetical protein [Alphaproteobacteria bacterium]
MKRYLTLLTLSFLSTSTFVEAGKIDIFDLPKDPEERRASLTAKAAKLQQNIDGAQDEALIKAFTTKHRVITNLLGANQVTDQDAEHYFAANEQIGNIKASFLQKALTRDFKGQCDKVNRILQSGIYIHGSQEFENLERAILNIRNLFSEYTKESEKLRAASHYLKIEKLVNQTVQNGHVIVDDAMAEAQQIKKSGLQNELRLIQESLTYNNADYEIIREVLWPVGTIYDSGDESEVFQAVLEYRTLKEKLEPVLEGYRKLKQKTPVFVTSILSGQYTELEEKLSRFHNRHDTPEGQEATDLLRIMYQIRALPFLYQKFRELEPKVRDALHTDPSLGDTFVQPGSSSGLPPAPVFFNDDEAPRENIANSVFNLNSEFETISGNPPTPKGYSFVADPEQKARKHGPKVVTEKYPGQVAITGDGYVLYSQLSSTDMKKLHGQKFRFEVEMKSTTPGAYVQYWGFKKSSEKLKSAPHSGNGAWQTLSVDFTIDKEATQYLIYPAIMPAVPSNSEAPVVKVRNVRITQL